MYSVATHLDCICYGRYINVCSMRFDIFVKS